MEKLLTVKEVAELLQIAPGSVYHWLSARRLTCVRLSARCVRFREKDLEALVEQLSVSSVTARKNHNAR
jgi:excisionase family DNA binding protein